MNEITIKLPKEIIEEAQKRGIDLSKKIKISAWKKIKKEFSFSL
jgi:hypothetical protein